MKNPIRQLCFVAAAALALTLTAALPAHAQAWPIKPVKYVVPFSPGDVSDGVAHLPADGFTLMGGTSRCSPGWGCLHRSARPGP